MSFDCSSADTGHSPSVAQRSAPAASMLQVLNTDAALELRHGKELAPYMETFLPLKEYQLLREVCPHAINEVHKRSSYKPL